MMEYDHGDVPRIQHFVKVYEFARMIGLMEGLDSKTQFTLESAAVVHDIGIHISEQKYGSSSGKYQELEGPAEAKKLLDGLEWPADVTERVCYLVGHHHTYHDMDGMDYQILVEADFLVNLFEDESVPGRMQKCIPQNIPDGKWKTAVSDHVSDSIIPSPRRNALFRVIIIKL